MLIMMYRQIKFNTFINIRKFNFSSIRFLTLNTDTNTKSERELENILSSQFPKAKSIKVEDVSGGCGAMYEIHVVSDDFKGLSIVKQHQSICDALKKQIKSFHGIRIHTEVPK